MKGWQMEELVYNIFPLASKFYVSFFCKISLFITDQDARGTFKPGTWGLMVTSHTQ
jgi:hypothetical protein